MYQPCAPGLVGPHQGAPACNNHAVCLAARIRSPTLPLLTAEPICALTGCSDVPATEGHHPGPIRGVPSLHLIHRVIHMPAVCPSWQRSQYSGLIHDRSAAGLTTKAPGCICRNPRAFKVCFASGGVQGQRHGSRHRRLAADSPVE